MNKLVSFFILLTFTAKSQKTPTGNPADFKIKTCLHSVSYAGFWRGQARLTVDEFLEKAKELGYEGVMLVTKRPHVSPHDYDKAARARLKAKIDSLGLTLVGLAGYTDFTAGIDKPGIPNAEIQAAWVGEMAELAKDLGTDMVRIFTGYERPGIPYDNQYAEVVEGLKMAGERAAEYGVTLAVQNHHDIALHHDAMYWLLKEVNMPNVMAGWDAWSPTLEGLSSEEIRASILKMKPYIVNTIVADYQAHQRFSYVNHLTNYKAEQPVMRAIPVGEGIIDYKTWFETMKEIGYQGWVVYEMCEVLDGGGSIENLDRTARVFLDYMKKLEAGIDKNNTLTESEKKEGWELLFDGKIFSGWRGIGKDKAPNGWVIEDGTIKILPKTDWPRQADGQPILGADLITADTFENFELVWEWKTGSGGNSGIKYNVSEELSMSYPPTGCALGFEYQMVDDSHLSGQGSRDNSTGALYDLVAPAKDKILKPVGEYNTSRIIFNGNHGEHWLNGKKVLEFDLETDYFNSLVQKSKFHDIPGFAEKRSGHIVLQDHAETAWFRNIKIRKLYGK
jgi:sugar phosphate isomerase/epimerase